ncbi:MAG TPA: hypothetical protein VMD99_17400 [Terriglobales bacterium]|nr:hypothetical protein [Terriglobales bacterium]
MKNLKFLALLSAVVLMIPLALFAREKNERSVNIPNSIQVSGKTLKPGDYKVEWQPDGSQVQVKFLQYGKAVASARATLKTNDSQVTQDDIQTHKAGANWELTEIDFGHQKEALVFSQS